MKLSIKGKKLKFSYRKLPLQFTCIGMYKIRERERERKRNFYSILWKNTRSIMSNNLSSE